MSDKPGKTFSMRRKKHTIGRLATLASLVFSLDCAAARDLGKGVEAWNKGRYEQAYPIFRHHADHGDTLAKMYLCRFYQQGDEKLRDDDEAFHWCRQAAVDGLDKFAPEDRPPVVMPFFISGRTPSTSRPRVCSACSGDRAATSARWCRTRPRSPRSSCGFHTSYNRCIAALSGRSVGFSFGSTAGNGCAAATEHTARAKVP
mgnify:CR=1 FL=1